MAIPHPEPGLVVSYVYLWHYEREAGRDEGRKDRPSVIVLVEREGRADIVTVLPITHVQPDPTVAIEIPQPVKRHLGLDGERSWIVVNEGNVFLWAGFDLRRTPKTNSYDYGFLPPSFFNRVVEAFGACHVAGKSRVIPRD